MPALVPDSAPPNWIPTWLYAVCTGADCIDSRPHRRRTRTTSLPCLPDPVKERRQSRTNQEKKKKEK